MRGELSLGLIVPQPPDLEQFYWNDQADSLRFNYQTFTYAPQYNQWFVLSHSPGESGTHYNALTTINLSCSAS